MMKLHFFFVRSGVLFSCLSAIVVLNADDSGASKLLPVPHMIVVVGASGSEEYEQPFREWASRWQSAADSLSMPCETIGLESTDSQPDLTRLTSSIAERTKTGGDLWLVLVGHGTFSANVAKFNLRGPDLSADALKDQFKDFSDRLVLIQCASSSGPFMNLLSGKNRIIVAATKSGSESNYARFGEYLSAAISDPAGDLDHDDQVSLLEAFLSASGNTNQFYLSEDRLATEHALLDDNGDALGTPATFFRGIRPVKRGKDNAAVDGRMAARIILSTFDQSPPLSLEQQAVRDEWEAKLDELKQEKEKLRTDEYFERLEAIMVELAKIK